MLTPANIPLYNSAAARPFKDDISYPLEDGCAVSSTLTYYSAPVSLRECSGFSAQAVWTGTPTGTLTIEVSNDPKALPWWQAQVDLATGGNQATWTAPASGSTFPASPAGSASNVVEQFTGLCSAYVRVKYVNASGSGNLKVFVCAKGD